MGCLIQLTHILQQTSASKVLDILAFGNPGPGRLGVGLRGMFSMMELELLFSFWWHWALNSGFHTC
jgi:hypothetical protein